VRVNIVLADGDVNWLAGRLARELVAALPRYEVEATINGGPADLEYQQIVYGPPTRRPAVGLFTHGTVRPAHFAKCYDGHIALNPEMAALLADWGARNPVVIEQAVDACYLHEGAPIFGVAGRVYGDRRKGEDLVVRMLDQGYRVRAWGSGWPPGCEMVPGGVEALPGFYRSIDYMLITSREEGGCTPIIEAMAMKVPVIAPRIGFAIVRPIIEYRAGNWESLHYVLRLLTEHRTYDDWARDHATYFKQVLR
jgi:hypothetical protein